MFKLTLGVSICLDVVSIETLDLNAKKRVSLDGRENLDSFKKLVSTIEISWSRSRNLDLVSMSLAKTVLFVEIETYQDLLRFLWLLVIFVDFLIFFSISTEK